MATTTRTTEWVDASGNRFRVQAMLPVSIGAMGAVCHEAEFKTYDGVVCVEALVRIGMIKSPYTVVLSIYDALDADIIESVE